MRSEVLCGFRLTIDYANRLIENIHEEQFAAQCNGMHNHPTWILGHLCVSFQAIGGEIGLSEWLPETWPAMFGTGSTPSADASAYPAKSQLQVMFRDSAERIDHAVEGLTENQMSVPLPDEEYRKVLPTLGHALVHILVGHASVHVGQLTAWRAAMGLPRVAERFDRT